MTYHSTAQPIKPKKSRPGLIIVVGTLAVLLLILVTVIGILFFTSQFGSAQSSQPNSLSGTRPLSQLNVDNVDPALALASLGGVSEADVIAEAIDKARPETALATLLFHSTLNNKESSGGFLQLANGYAQGGKTDKAVFSYEMAGKVATLAPDIPDTVRADVFLQVSEGLIGLHKPVLAEFYLNQAFIVASKSPFLQAAHRRSIFQQLQKNYIIVEQRELARQSLSLGANAPNPTQVIEEQTVLPDNQPVPLPEAVQEAEANRWRAAQELAILLVERGGRAPQNSIDALAEALIAEDQQKLSFYKREFAKTTQLSKRIDFTLVQIAWLSIKYLVARRAYGISIVPEWEAQAGQIRADLTKTYENLFALYADLVVALPEASQIDKASEERLRSEVLAGELGRYPNYPEEQRRKQLLDASEQLVKTQPEINIFVAIGAVQNEERYTLISIE
jgi:hypothetical protein